MIKNLRTRLAVVSACVGALSLTGCLPEDDFSDLEVKAPSPSIALPLLNTNLSVTDIITVEEGKGLLTENEDQTYSVLYQSGVQTPPVSEFFPGIPDQQYAQGFSLGVNSPAFGVRSSPQKFSDAMPVDTENVRIYSIESEQGQMTLSLSSDYQHSVEAEVTFPSIISKASGTPLVWNPTIAVYSIGPATQRYDLADYVVNLTDGKAAYDIVVTIDGSGNPINDSEELTLGVDLEGVDFAYLSGSFAGISIPIEGDTIAIPVLENAVEGSIALNPTLDIRLENSYGAPVSTDLSKVFVQQRSGQLIQLQDQGDSVFFTSNYQFPYLSQRDEAPAAFMRTINRSSSNIDDAFAQLPRNLQYQLGFTIGGTLEDTSFLTRESTISADVKVDLPLEGNFDLILEDTIAVDFGDLENVEEMKILIKTENSFPLNARLKVFFLDEEKRPIVGDDGQPISLFGAEDKFLAAALLEDTQSGATQPATVDLPLVGTIDQAQFNEIRTAQHLLVRTDLESVSSQDNFIKLYAFYGIRFSLATQIKTSFDQ